MDLQGCPEVLVLEVVEYLSREGVEGIGGAGVAGCGDEGGKSGRFGSCHCRARHFEVLYRLSSVDNLVRVGVKGKKFGVISELRRRVGLEPPDYFVMNTWLLPLLPSLSGYNLSFHSFSPLLFIKRTR